jgi:hypothetical protein
MFRKQIRKRKNGRILIRGGFEERRGGMQGNLLSKIVDDRRESL